MTSEDIKQHYLPTNRSLFDLDLDLDSYIDLGHVLVSGINVDGKKPNGLHGYSTRVPGEIKSREVEQDPRPRRDHDGREVELGCESWTSFASGCSSTTVQQTLSL